MLAGIRERVSFRFYVLLIVIFALYPGLISAAPAWSSSDIDYYCGPYSSGVGNGSSVIFTNSSCHYLLNGGTVSNFGTKFGDVYVGIPQSSTLLDGHSLGFPCTDGVCDSAQTDNWVGQNLAEDQPMFMAVYSTLSCDITSLRNYLRTGGSEPCTAYGILQMEWGKPFFHIVSQDIATSTTWLTNHVYRIDGEVEIDPGITLTIQSGAIVKFKSATSSLIVNGTLDAIGTSTATSTYFTSLNDDTAGGDTDNDATSTPPVSGDWAGIQINAGGTASFGHVFIGYGGSVDGSNAMVHNDGGVLNISTSTVANGDNYGIRTSAGTTTILATDISFNDYGFYLSGGFASISASSTIHENVTYGVFNNTTATSSLLAENNFWATSTGPFNSLYNPTGTGDAVSNYVDFSPWIGQIHYVTQEVETNCLLSSTCSSVNSNQVLIHSTSTYSTEISSAMSTWNSVGAVDFVTESDENAADLWVNDINRSDLAILGEWRGKAASPDILVLNTYFLDSAQFSNLRESTIVHELGHALGLHHSYWGNVMYAFPSLQISLGTQDQSDYDYLW